MHIMLCHLCLALYLFSAMAGCGPEADGSGPKYAFGFYNDSDIELHDVGFSWEADGRQHENPSGFLSPGVEKTEFGGQPRPIPEKMTVVWKTPDGKQHREEGIEVAKLVPDAKNFSGTIYFKFLKSGKFKVVPLTNDEMMRMARLGKDPLTAPEAK